MTNSSGKVLANSSKRIVRASRINAARAAVRSAYQQLPAVGPDCGAGTTNSILYFARRGCDDRHHSWRIQIGYGASARRWWLWWLWTTHRQLIGHVAGQFLRRWRRAWLADRSWYIGLLRLARRLLDRRLGRRPWRRRRNFRRFGHRLDRLRRIRHQIETLP